MSTTTYEVEGLTCGACIGEVLRKVLDLAGVDEATMNRTADAYSSPWSAPLPRTSRVCAGRCEPGASP